MPELNVNTSLSANSSALSIYVRCPSNFIWSSFLITSAVVCRLLKLKTTVDVVLNKIADTWVWAWLTFSFLTREMTKPFSTSQLPRTLPDESIIKARSRTGLHSLSRREVTKELLYGMLCYYDMTCHIPPMFSNVHGSWLCSPIWHVEQN